MGNLGKIIIATGFEWLPQVQKIAKFGHTGHKQIFMQRNYVILKYSTLSDFFNQSECLISA